MEVCDSLRHPAQVPGKQLRTANFSEADRERFAKTAARARRAAGFKSRRAFAEAAKVGKRSIDAVELFEPTVGEDVLEAIGRTLGRYFDDWNEDTPRAILEDGLVPANVPKTNQSSGVGAATESQPRPVARYPDQEVFLRSVIEHLRKQGMPEGDILRAVEEIITEVTDAEGNQPGTSSNGMD